MENILQLEGSPRSSMAYGADYLTELRRVIRTHVVRREGNFLEWGMGNSTRFPLESRAELGIAALFSTDHDSPYFQRVTSIAVHAINWFTRCTRLPRMSPQFRVMRVKPAFLAQTK